MVDLVHKHLHIKKAKQSFAKYMDNKTESKIFTQFTALALVNEQSLRHKYSVLQILNVVK